jgi:redox-sensitive bicupin YhaK (pirin superfamily)
MRAPDAKRHAAARAPVSIHDEIPAEGVTVHSLQLWVNLPAADKMTGRVTRILPAMLFPWGDNQV